VSLKSWKETVGGGGPSDVQHKPLSVGGRQEKFACVRDLNEREKVAWKKIFCQGNYTQKFVSPWKEGPKKL